MASDPKRAEIVARNAEDAFWRTVAESYPTETGDLAPGDAIPFSAACLRAVTAWLASNAVDGDDSGDDDGSILGASGFKFGPDDV